jgi:hypothetical protein
MILSGEVVKKLALLLATCSIAVSFCGELNDWLIVPGTRAGPVTAKTTRADVVRIFGEDNVEDGDVTIADEVHPATMVMEDQPDAALAIEWNNDKPEPHVASIHFCHAALPPQTCRWHTEDGITKGTPLKILEKLNSGRFKLLGFGWDWEGTVTSWNGGTLEPLAKGCFGLRIIPRREQSVPDQLQGDKEFWSSDPAMQALDPIVAYMSLGFKCGSR